MMIKNYKALLAALMSALILISAMTARNGGGDGGNSTSNVNNNNTSVKQSSEEPDSDGTVNLLSSIYYINASSEDEVMGSFDVDDNLGEPHKKSYTFKADPDDPEKECWAEYKLVSALISLKVLKC